MQAREKSIEHKLFSSGQGYKPDLERRAPHVPRAIWPDACGRFFGKCSASVQ